MVRRRTPSDKGNRITSAEMTSWWRQKEHVISRVPLAKAMTPDDISMRRAEDFQKYVYPGIARHIALRHRFISDQSESLSRSGGCPQLVNIGAGFSSLGRVPAIPSLDRIFEIDVSSVIEVKKKRLSQLVGLDNISDEEQRLVQKTRFITHDVTSTSVNLLGKIQSDGFEIDKGTILVMEGLIYYLAFEVVERLLRSFGDTCTGDLYVIFDYWPESASESNTFQRMLEDFSTSIIEQVLTPTYSDSRLNSLLARFSLMSRQGIESIERFYEPTPSKQLLQNVQMRVPTILCIAKSKGRG